MHHGISYEIKDAPRFPPDMRLLLYLYVCLRFNMTYMPSLRYALACHLCAVITRQIHDLLKLRSLNRRLAQTLMPAIRQNLS